MMKKLLMFSILFGMICSGCSFSSELNIQEVVDTGILQATIPSTTQSGNELKREEKEESYFTTGGNTESLKTGYLPLKHEALSKLLMSDKSGIYTNDLSWEVEMLSVLLTGKDEKSYKVYFLPEPHPAVIPADPLDWHGEDKEYLFLDFGLVATKKSELPNYIPLQFMGTQAVMGLVGHSDGYLVISPFKFPVDEDSFTAIQDKEQFHDRKDNRYSSVSYGALGERPGFHNGGVDYRNYLGEDKDWVYFWDDQNIQGLSINRVKKESDFKFGIFLPIPFSPID